MRKINLNIFHEEFKDFIESLNKANVNYIVVGGYSVILHGYNRTTGDLDIWVGRTQENYLKLMKAFQLFGLPTTAIPVNDFVNNKQIEVYTFGRPPLAIDIMTEMKGASFEDAFEQAEMIEVEGQKLRLLHYNHLIMAKKAAGRHKDLDDLENLENK